VLGTSIDIPTLDGPATVKVPSGTQPDTMLRLHGKGLPQFGGGSRGGLYVRIQVHIPERLSDHDRHLFEQLKTKSARKVRRRAERA
jgi:molecular chaperone DnaJ